MISSVGLSDWSSLRSTIAHNSRTPLVAAACERLEVLAFLELAVAEHHHDAALAAEEPLRPRHARALRDAHPERARVRLDPGDADVGMAVEAAERRSRSSRSVGITPSACSAA